MALAMRNGYNYMQKYIMGSTNSLEGLNLELPERCFMFLELQPGIKAFNADV